MCSLHVLSVRRMGISLQSKKLDGALNLKGFSIELMVSGVQNRL